jgi:hypothetical protein
MCVRAKERERELWGRVRHVASGIVTHGCIVWREALPATCRGHTSAADTAMYWYPLKCHQHTVASHRHSHHHHHHHHHTFGHFRPLHYVTRTNSSALAYNSGLVTVLLYTHTHTHTHTHSSIPDKVKFSVQRNDYASRLCSRFRLSLLKLIVIVLSCQANTRAVTSSKNLRSSFLIRNTEGLDTTRECSLRLGCCAISKCVCVCPSQATCAHISTNPCTNIMPLLFTAAVAVRLAVT